MYNYYFSPGSGSGCDDLPAVKGNFPMPQYDDDADKYEDSNNSKDADDDESH